MSTLKVEQSGEDLVIRITADARASLGVRPGDEVLLSRSPHGEMTLAAAEMDHQLRLERGRAFLRRLQSPVG